MILVVGATGRVGREIVKQLRQQRRPVRALCRTEAKARSLRDAGVDVVLGDLADRQAIEKACHGTDTIISTMTSLNPRAWRAPYRPEAIEGDGHRNIMATASRVAVKQFIYLSAVGVEHPDAPRQFRIKRQVEEIVTASGVPYTILRPAGFMESLVPMLDVMRRFRIAPLPGRGTSPTSYIAVEDVAQVAVQAAGRPEAHEATIEFGGPEDLSNRQCVQIAAKVLGTPARICPVPLSLLHVAGTFARPVSPGLREFFAILRFVDQYGLRAPHRPPFPAEPWTPISFEEFVRGHTGVR